jgi:hypothetical protein
MEANQIKTSVPQGSQIGYLILKVDGEVLNKN